mgnify:CR=1 FL=1
MSARPFDDAEAAEAARLMADYCDGQAKAFHALYARVAPRLLGYLTNLAGDRPTAEDLLQLTFMKLHEARSTYVRGANPVPWIYTIAHRTCLDELRRRKRARVRLSPKDGEVPEVAVGLAGASVESSEAADQESAVAVAVEALAKLPDNQREALVLTKVEGRSHAEAAALSGTPVGAIKLRAHRGYVALRKMLGKGEDSLGGDT